MGTDQHDVIVVGAGHNGLTCAAYLAAAGLSVTLYESRGIAGGADVILNRALIRRLFPYVAEATTAMLHARRCGWLSAQQLGVILLDRARTAGCRLVRGRVTAANQVFMQGGPQLGQLEAGAVAAGFGAPFSVISGGVACVLTVLLIGWKAPAIRGYRIDR